jgi:hypothetical protein
MAKRIRISDHPTGWAYDFNMLVNRFAVSKAADTIFDVVLFWKNNIKVRHTHETVRP